MPIEKYKQAWEKFQNKMNSLKKRRFEIITEIYRKIDQKKIDLLRNKIKNQ